MNQIQDLKDEIDILSIENQRLKKLETLNEKYKQKISSQEYLAIKNKV